MGAHTERLPGGIDPARNAQKETPYQGQGAKVTSDNQDFTAKPEVDLKSWAALGSGVKPSRTDRRQKRGWKRQQPKKAAGRSK